MAAYASREVEVERDGLRLRGTVCVPIGGAGYAAAPWPVAILMHGITANRNAYRFVRIAEELAARGIASVRFDLNGRGQSDGRFEDMTVPKELDDLDAILRFVRTQPDIDAGRLALVGHSQGGVDAALCAARHPLEVAALVLLAPAGVLEDDARNRVNVRAFPVGDEYVRTACELHIYETAAAYRGPACIIHGKLDDLVPLSYAQRFAEIYDGADLHVLADDDHSLMREIDLIEKIVAAFIDKHLYPKRDQARQRETFVDMLRRMRQAGQLGSIEAPDAPLPPRIAEGIVRFGVTEGDLA